MGGVHEQKVVAAGQDPQQSRAAEADNSAAVFAAVMAGSQVSPESVAKATKSHPMQRDAMMTTIHQRYGNSYAQQVVGAMNASPLLTNARGCRCVSET